MARKKQSFVVVGLGRFGGRVARQLSQLGNHVMGFDSNETRISAFVDDLAETVIGDARDSKALSEAGVGSFDKAVVAIGSNLEASILSFMNLRDLGIEDIVVKAYDERHARILGEIGAHEVVTPEHSAGEHIARRLHNSAIVEFMDICPGQTVAMIEAEGSKATEKLGKTLSADGDLQCFGVVRDGALIAAESALAEPLRDGDQILVQGDSDAVADLASSLR